MRVSICVCTFKRAEMLKILLKGIDSLIFRKCPVPDITVVVVDNDPEKSAQSYARMPLVNGPSFMQASPNPELQLRAIVPLGRLAARSSWP